MKIEEILRTKGREVITIHESQSVLAAAQILVDKNIGGLVVAEDGHPTGILTERDLLRLAAQNPDDLAAIHIGAIMTRKLITAGPQDELLEVMAVMTENKIRHLPIMENDRLIGIISIGDLVNALRVIAERENSQLRQYIQGGG